MTTKMKTRSKAWGLMLASAFVMIVGFHNCSGSSFPGGFTAAPGGDKISINGPVLGLPNGASPVTGGPRIAVSSNGGTDGYDGMSAASYVSLTRAGQTCPDGSNVVSEVEVNPNGQAYLTRDNCAPVAPKHLAPNNYQRVSGFGEEYLVVAEQAYQRVDTEEKSAVRLFCHGYSESRTSTNLSGMAPAPFQALKQLSMVNYFSPLITSVNVIVSGNQAQVTVSKHPTIMFNLAPTGSDSYNGVSLGGDRISLDTDAGLISIFFADGSTAIEEMRLTCESQVNP